MRPRKGGYFAWAWNDFKLLGEFGAELVNVLVAVGQTVACVGFYPEHNGLYRPACIIFFVTSAISVFILLHAIHEAHEVLALNDAEEGKHQREVAELVLFLVSSILFAVGSVLFLPDVSKYAERTDIHAGTWCFLLGSADLALAFFVNSLSVAQVGTWRHQTLKNKLGILSLFLGQFGSALFLIGTPAFFPQLYGNSRWNIVRFGTHLYLAGCIAFLLGALLNLALAHVKHSEHGELLSTHTGSYRSSKSCNDLTEA